MGIDGGGGECWRKMTRISQAEWVGHEMGFDRNEVRKCKRKTVGCQG
jgi:hypothetical protein